MKTRNEILHECHMAIQATHPSFAHRVALVLTKEELRTVMTPTMYGNYEIVADHQDKYYIGGHEVHIDERS